MIRNVVGILLFSILISEASLAQINDLSPIYNTTGADIPLSIGIASVLGTGIYLDATHDSLSREEYENLKPYSFFANEWSLTLYKGYESKNRGEHFQFSPENLSDDLLMISVIGGLVTPFFANQSSHADNGAVSLMYVQSLALDIGINEITKALARKPRPYVHYDKEVQNLSYDDFHAAHPHFSDANLSNFSGHTSVTAAACFFSARMFCDYSNDKNAKPYVVASAAIIPAIVAYLRMRGGYHSFVEVLSGYVAGGLIGGVAIPELHKTKSNE
ncbi:MAG: phosphatase PAP2 family protein [Chitinophagales bacterium]